MPIYTIIHIILYRSRVHRVLSTRRHEEAVSRIQANDSHVREIPKTVMSDALGPSENYQKCTWFRNSELTRYSQHAWSHPNILPNLP